jgi:hypothetical protein
MNSSETKELAEIILTKSHPQNSADVFYYRTNKVPDGLSKAIIKFSEMPYVKSKYAGLDLINWQAVITQ